MTKRNGTSDASTRFALVDAVGRDDPVLGAHDVLDPEVEHLLSLAVIVNTVSAPIGVDAGLGPRAAVETIGELPWRQSLSLT